MAQTFGTFKSMADQRDREAVARAKAAAANTDSEKTPIADAARLPAATHQERVNAEMFKAMEILGRKIDRAFDEREHLTRRLALIESAATVDEKTGKLYLPVIAEGLGTPALPPPVSTTASAPRWMIVTTVLSTAIAVTALALVALRPMPQALTAEQLAILDALAQTRMGALTAPLSGTATPESWQPLDAAPEQRPTQEQDSAVRQDYDAAAPSEDELSPPMPLPQDSSAVSSEAPLVQEESTAAPAQAEISTTVPTQDSAPVAQPDNTAASDADDSSQAPLPLTIQNNTPAAPAAPAANKEPVVAPAAKPVARPAAPAGEFKTDAAAPPLVAGLDIGRDTALPAALISLETRAMEGTAAAQHDLATIYAAGKDTKQDYKRAAYWFSQAAQGGIANANYNLGVMFQQGLGLRKDAAKAMDWYKKAADLGHPEAMYNLGIAYIEGVGTTRNVDKGIAYFEKAATAGVAQAAYNLGVLYESGFAGPIDLATARTWYETASTQGHAEAREALTRLDAQLGSSANTTPIPPADRLTPADLVEPAAGDSTPSAPPARAPAQKKSPIYKNDLVGKVQRALIGRGLLPSSAATGVIDARTEDAIRAFQRAHNLPIDGIPSLPLLGQINQTSR